MNKWVLNGLALIGGVACGYGVGVVLYGLYVVGRIAYSIGLW